MAGICGKGPAVGAKSGTITRPALPNSSISTKLSLNGKGYPYSASDIKRFAEQGWLTGGRAYTKSEIKAIKDFNKGKINKLPQSVIDKNTKLVL